MLLFRIAPQIKRRIGGKGFVYIMNIILFIKFVADGFLFSFSKWKLCVTTKYKFVLDFFRNGNYVCICAK